jgi:hypothetical protein
VGVACCILEYILEYHFSPYFDRARWLVERGNRRFRLTLAYCWKLGQAAEPGSAKAMDLFVATLTDAQREKARYDRGRRRPRKG